MAEHLRCDARSWAAQVRTMSELSDLSVLGAKAGVPQFGQLEMAGSWSVSQLTASRWQEEAERFVTALPQTLALLETGQLLRHQAVVLLHRTRHCTVEVAGKVEAEVLPAATGWCPADIGRRVDRVVLRIESEQADAAAAEQHHADAAAERRTFTRPELDGMGLAGAVLTAEQLVGWSAGMDSLERRERVADRRAGIDRTAPQRRADLFAALPAMVLAGTAQDAGAQDAGAQDAGAQDAGAQDAAGVGAGAGAVGADADDAGGGTCVRPWTLGPELIAAQIVLNVHVPVSTVLEVSRKPGSLDGYGPVSAEHVRLLRPTLLRRVLVDGLTGRPLALDDRPTPGRARPAGRPRAGPADAHPGGGRRRRRAAARPVRPTGPADRPARRALLRPGLLVHPLRPRPPRPVAGRTTSARNLGLASPRCHQAKHHGWLLVRHPDGSVTWTQPPEPRLPPTLPARSPATSRPLPRLAAAAPATDRHPDPVGHREGAGPCAGRGARHRPHRRQPTPSPSTRTTHRPCEAARPDALR